MPSSPDGGSVPAITGPTWAQDVAPLVSQHCSSCHVAGGIAPFALTTYAEAAEKAPLMAASVANRSMPPWMPGGATPALEHDRTLTTEQIAVFQQWFENGAPEGDTAHPASLPSPEVIPFENPDVTFDTGVDYVPDSSLTDDYRCFLVDPAFATAHMATALKVTPGNRATVHHVIATLFDAADRAGLQAVDDASAGPGWQCFGGPVPTNSGLQPSGGLGSWVPGVSALVYPTGTATRVPAGSFVVVQVHYNLAGGTAPDRTKLELKFAPAGTESSLQPISGIRLIKFNLDIPAGATGHVEEQALTAKQWTLNRFYADGEGWMIGVAGHMHTRGARIQILQTNAAGEQTLLDIPHWDFHWQGSYFFKTPIKVVPTDTITIRCTYDNPGATALAWGEGTADEMCLAQVQVVDQLPPH
ncbi:MAG: hypothetical protein QM817_27110 [Archangium sp.]